MKKLKLNVLASESLSKIEMNQVKGGNSCTCGCQYADKGGSSIEANCNANYSGSKTTPKGVTAQCMTFDLMTVNG
jgi:natural product precursor